MTAEFSLRLQNKIIPDVIAQSIAIFFPQSIAIANAILRDL